MAIKTASSLIVSVLLLTLTGCQSMEQTSKSMTTDKPLYERLGGKPAITAVVEDFIARVAADTRINGKFANTDIPRLKMLLVEQISTHTGMGVSNADFDALVGDLVATLNKFKVPERERNELLGALGPMKIDIVERPQMSMY